MKVCTVVSLEEFRISDCGFRILSSIRRTLRLRNLSRRHTQNPKSDIRNPKFHSLVPQGYQRIDFRRSPRRDIACDHRNQQEAISPRHSAKADLSASIRRAALRQFAWLRRPPANLRSRPATTSTIASRKTSHEHVPRLRCPRPCECRSHSCAARRRRTRRRTARRRRAATRAVRRRTRAALSVSAGRATGLCVRTSSRLYQSADCG